MPLYDGDCQSCGIVEVYKSMNAPWPKKCPKCGAKGFDRIFNSGMGFIPAADSGWELESNGAGRYCPQLGRIKRPDGSLNPDTHCRSRAEAIDKFKARGYPNIEKD